MLRAVAKNYFNYEFYPMIISEKLLGGIKFLKENTGKKIYKHVKKLFL